MVRISVRDIWMRFGKVIALQDVSFATEESEFMTLLGPSGCGKTTLLRIVAGLYRPIRGRIFFDEEDVTEKPPWDRKVGLVFQDYALWPHMKVYDNIAYGLKLRKVPKEEQDERIMRVASLLHIEGLLDRYPHQLSGGQQQRIALARAVVVNPNILLLDEPLSNLDAKVRVNVRTEIRKLQKQLKITSIYVTHDQEEALTISDRIVVMNIGRIEQVGTPFEIYHNPQTLFVADFVGQINMISGSVAETNFEKGVVFIDSELGLLKIQPIEGLLKGDKVHLVFRPEYVVVAKNPLKESNALEGVVDSIHYLGNIARLDVKVRDKIVKAEVYKPIETWLPRVGEKVCLEINPEHLRAFKG